MIDLFVTVLLNLNKILFNNLGLTIIVIGLLSRLIFHPFFASSLRYSKAMRDIKPKLDEVKKRYQGDMRKVATEQSRLFREAGINPAAGAIGCLSIIIQLVVFFLLFRSLSQVIASGVDTRFLVWDLSRPDAFDIKGIPIKIPGILVLATSAFSFIQSKMILTPTPGNVSAKKAQGKGDFSEALLASQSQTAYIIPLIILFTGTRFASGLALYWLVSTISGIIQQYLVTGLGGLKPWLVRLNLTK